MPASILEKSSTLLMHAQQVLGRVFGHLLQALLLLGLDGVALQQVGQADDGVHRRADLVAHVGQEGALGQVGRLRSLGGLGERGGAGSSTSSSRWWR